MSGEKIGVFLETGDAVLAELLSEESLAAELNGAEDLQLFSAPSWSDASAASRIGELCREQSLSRVVVCASARSADRLPEWVGGDNGDAAVPITCATIRSVDEDGSAHAARLVRMAVARARQAAPLQIGEVAAERRVVVLGGNHGAMASARALAAAGHPVTLLRTAPPSGCYYELGEDELKPVLDHPAITVIDDARIDRVEGGLGNFKLWTADEAGRHVLCAGALVVAVDAESLPLHLAPELADSGKVITLRSYSDRLNSGDAPDGPVVIWLDHQNHDRRCAGLAAVELALHQARRGSPVYVLARQMPVYGEQGQLRYDEARLAGVTFLRTTQQPEVEVGGRSLLVRVTDSVLPDKPIEIAADLLVLPEPVRPSAAHRQLAHLLQQPLDRQGFLQSGNVRHRPVGSARRGVFFVGGCHDECDPAEARLEAQAVVAELAAQLPDAPLRLPLEKVAYDKGHCAACLNCVRVCPHGAIEPIEDTQHRMQVLDSACWQCGICTSVCPGLALEHGSMRFGQMHAVLAEATRTLAGRAPIIGFACHQSAVAAADSAMRQGLSLPRDLLLIDVPCAGLISDRILLDAIEQGARGAVVLGCHHDNCRSLWGSDITRRRVGMLHEWLEASGLGGQRICFHSLAANEPHRLVHLLEKAVAAFPEGTIEQGAGQGARQEASNG